MSFLEKHRIEQCLLRINLFVCDCKALCLLQILVTWKSCLWQTNSLVPVNCQQSEMDYTLWLHMDGPHCMSCSWKCTQQRREKNLMVLWKSNITPKEKSKCKFLTEPEGTEGNFLYTCIPCVVQTQMLGPIKQLKISNFWCSKTEREECFSECNW